MLRAKNCYIFTRVKCLYLVLFCLVKWVEPLSVFILMENQEALRTICLIGGVVLGYGCMESRGGGYQLVCLVFGDMLFWVCGCSPGGTGLPVIGPGPGIGGFF